MAEEFLQYKNKPLVRCGDVIYYGDMNDKCVAKLTVKSKTKVDDMEFADRVFIQILNTDMSDPKKTRSPERRTDRLVSCNRHGLCMAQKSSEILMNDFSAACKK